MSSGISRLCTQRTAAYWTVLKYLTSDPEVQAMEI